MRKERARNRSLNGYFYGMVAYLRRKKDEAKCSDPRGVFGRFRAAVGAPMALSV